MIHNRNSHFYGIPQVPINLHCDCPPILAAWREYFQYCNPDLISTSCCIDVSLSVGDPVPDAWKELQARGKLIDHGSSRCWKDNGTDLTEFCWGAGWVGHSKTESRVSGSIKPGALLNPQLVHAFTTFVMASTLDVLLASLPDHIVALHASAVAKGEASMLVMGNSGSGKTTICTSLLERGFSLLSDDLTLLDLSSEPLSVLPFLTFAHISIKTLRFLPRLADKIEEEADENGEFIVPSRKITSIYTAPPQRQVPLSIVALGETSPERRSLIIPIEPTEILARGYAECGVIDNRSLSEKEQNLARILENAPNIVSIRSGLDMPVAVEEAFTNLAK